MTTTAKALPALGKTRINWRTFAANFTAKASENILDMVITIATVGMLLAYISATQPLAAVEYGGYIIAVYLLILFLRIVQDFDESYTNDELGTRLDLLVEMTNRVYQQMDDDPMNDDDFRDRINSVMG